MVWVGDGRVPFLVKQSTESKAGTRLRFNVLRRQLPDVVLKVDKKEEASHRDLLSGILSSPFSTSHTRHTTGQGDIRPVKGSFPSASCGYMSLIR